MAASRLTAKQTSFRTDDEKDKQAQIDRLQRMNHDLRQPLQATDLLCGILRAKTKDEGMLKVIARLEKALGSIRKILNALPGPDRPETPIAYPECYEALAPKTSPCSESAISPSTETERLLSPAIFIVDDDCEVRDALSVFLKSQGYPVEHFGSCEQLLEAYQPNRRGCLLIDAFLPGMSGIECLKRIKTQNDRLPIIMITGRGDVALAVQAMKAGAVDFIEKPINHKELLAVVSGALQQAQDAFRPSGDRAIAIAYLARLSARERQVINLILEGHPNKNIAADLGIHQRTVETHRANIMRKMEVKSLSALLRLALAAA